MSDFIKRLDLMSPELKLTTKDGPRHKTVVGGFFTILCSITIIPIGLYFTIKTFQRKSASIIYNEDMGCNPIVDLFQYPIKISIIDFCGQNFAKEHRVVKFNFLFNYLDEKMDLQQILLPLVSCSKDVFSNTTFIKNEELIQNKKIINAEIIQN